jgi:hypothetical protein
MLSNPINAVCNGSGCFGFGHIFDDDGAPFASINNVTVREPIQGTKLATFTVTLSHPHPGFEVSVDWSTRAGTARAASICAPFITGGFPDYASGSGTLDFAPGDQSAQVTVTICGDTIQETTQTFFVDLTGGSNALTGSSGTGSILDAFPSLQPF